METVIQSERSEEEDKVVISKESYGLLFSESRRQLRASLKLVEELRRNNAVLREAVKEFVHFLNDPQAETHSINSVLAEIMPEI